MKTEYLSTSEYSNPKYVALIEQAIATKPDGLAVAITDPQALDGAVRQAIDMGIPVIAFNTPDPRAKENTLYDLRRYGSLPGWPQSR